MLKENLKVQHSDGDRGKYLPQEKKDCVVRALAIATKKPYFEVHAILKKLGRKDGKSFRSYPSQWEGMFKPYGINLKKLEYLGNVRNFVMTHTVGKYVLSFRHHMIPVVDGVIYDIYAENTSLCGNCKVRKVFEVI
jgi:hypothetical protein